MTVRQRQWRDKSTGEIRTSWTIDIGFRHADGRQERVRMTSPVNTRAGAARFERQKRRAMLAADEVVERSALPAPAPPGPAQRPVAPTLREFVPKYIEYATNNNRPSTVATKEAYLRDHLLPAFGNKRLDEIRFAEVEAFKAMMRTKQSQSRHYKAAPTKWAIKKRYGAPPKTLSAKLINNVLSCLRNLLNVAMEYEVLDRVPRVKLFKTIAPVFDFLEFDEAENLVAAADREWRPLIEFALKSGLRQGEQLGLEWSDVDLVRGRVNVRRSIWKGQELPPKGGRQRTVEVPNSVVTTLKTLPRRGTNVFCHEDGEPFSKDELKSPLERALRKANISREVGRIGWHDMRHTYASHLAMKGVPLKVIQELLGHTTIEMTLRYAHLSPDMKQQAVQVLDQPVGGRRRAPALVTAGAADSSWEFSAP